jgi:hypothetical protein
MICDHCKSVFCWDDADEGTLGGQRRRYCSQTCQRAAARRKQHQTLVRLQMCRERPKPGYVTREAASLAAGQLGRIPPLYPYACPCGRWHLTSEAQAARS